MTISWWSVFVGGRSWNAQIEQSTFGTITKIFMYQSTYVLFTHTRHSVPKDLCFHTAMLTHIVFARHKQYNVLSWQKSNTYPFIILLLSK